MTPRNPQTFERRQFLRTASGLVAGAFGAVLARGDELPENVNPRAIFGDSVEPDWEQRMLITVGPNQADLVGTTDRVIQAAVDYVARRGGGTVRVLPGTYRMRNSIFLQSKVRILGSGTDAVLVKEPSVTTRLIVDSDHWDQEITLADPKGFQVGDGVRLVSKDPYGKGTNIIQRTLIASSGNRFKLDRRLEERFHLEGGPQIATNSSLLQCTNVADVVEDCSYGMTIGHRDSDNLIRDNDIRRSGMAGIHFRGGNKAFAPHRNRIERNRVVDSGPEKGVAIDINGETESVTLVKNELRETRKPLSRIGILIGAETHDIRCVDNLIEGFATAISDLRKR